MKSWIPISEISRDPAGERATVSRRKRIISAIMDRLVEARAFRIRAQHYSYEKEWDIEIFCAAAQCQFLEEVPWPFTWRIEDCSLPDWSQVEGFHLFKCPLKNTDWMWQSRSDFGLAQYKSDWDLGHFHSRTLGYNLPEYGGDADIGFIYREFDAFSVEVESEAVERILGTTTKANAAIRQRATKYDWESAFADVAAELYHDIEFANLNARGVQTEIIALLRKSFESRGLAVPSDDTLKPKAAKLLGALRGKKP